MPYKGSKNAIAKKIVEILPPADTLVDLFAGGCAVTHCAMTQDKYKHYIANDINNYPSMLIECFEGKHTTKTHDKWITREEFQEKKDTDNYIKYCWSFGNNGKDYAFGKGVQTDWNHGMWQALFHNDFSIISNYGIDCQELRAIRGGIPDRKKCLNQILKRYFDTKGSHLYVSDDKLKTLPYETAKRLIPLERLIGLELLQSAQATHRLECLENDKYTDLISITQADYQDVTIPENSIVYCDIPYIGTNSGSYQGFDYDRFYNWALQQDNIFISEYEMPDDFIPIANFKKQVNSTAKGSTTAKKEYLFTNKQTAEKYGFANIDT